MKKSLMFRALLTAIVIVAPFSVSAHDLEFDKNIGALMHIEPADEVVAGAVTTLEFHFVDTAKKFLPDQCNCSVAITDAQQKKIFSTILDAADTSLGADTRTTEFIFPTAGTYTVEVVGTPRLARIPVAIFPMFHLMYDVQVEAVAATTTVVNALTQPFVHLSHVDTHHGWSIFFATFVEHGLHIILFGGAFLIAIAIIVRDKRREKRYTEGQNSAGDQPK